MQLINAVFCITMLVLYYSEIRQYALYLENTVRDGEIVTLCKIWNLYLRVLSCETRILKTVRNDPCSQAALQSGCTAVSISPMNMQ